MGNGNGLEWGDKKTRFLQNRILFCLIISETFLYILFILNFCFFCRALGYLNCYVMLAFEWRLSELLGPPSLFLSVLALPRWKRGPNVKTHESSYYGLYGGGGVLWSQWAKMVMDVVVKLFSGWFEMTSEEVVLVLWLWIVWRSLQGSIESLGRPPIQQLNLNQSGWWVCPDDQPKEAKFLRWLRCLVTRLRKGTMVKSKLKAWRVRPSRVTGI